MRLAVTHTHGPFGTRRTALLTDTGSKDIEIFFEIPELLPQPDVLDGFVAAIIFFAMSKGTSLKVEGPMSREALLNLGAMQEAWACWRPHIYRRVDILPSEVRDDIRRVTPPKAITAFSGGVDSIFTAIRHSTRALGAASYPLTDALLVHGFDVSLSNQDHFDLLVARIKPLLDELGLRLRILRTNLKEVEIQEWEDSFIAQLAGCLHNYSHEVCYGLAGSGEPYNALVLPWGQNPCTDQLLSGARLAVVHDGAGFSRTEKVAAVARHSTATRAVKVCWQGKDAFANCGQCEKCVRTQLNFLAVGCPAPTCFDSPLRLDQISEITPSNAAQRNELSLIVQYANEHDVAAPWLAVLKRRLRRPPANLLRGEFLELFRKARRRAKYARWPRKA